MKHVTIHTDGACKGNPGPGGWGAVLQFGRHRKELSAGYRLTTNNRMELRAAISALELLSEPCQVDLYSDSKYLVQAINEKWIAGWKRRGWRKADNSEVKNRDLWVKIDGLCARHQIRWHWVKGHAGHDLNERCDQLANHAVANGPLGEDEGFDSSPGLWTGV
jgi:ribonuclease HI